MLIGARPTRAPARGLRARARVRDGLRRGRHRGRRSTRTTRPSTSPWSRSTRTRTLSVRLSREWAAGLAIAIVRLVEAGRPLCPLCGGPLDPQGPRLSAHQRPSTRRSARPMTRDEQRPLLSRGLDRGRGPRRRARRTRPCSSRSTLEGVSGTRLLQGRGRRAAAVGLPRRPLAPRGRRLRARRPARHRPRADDRRARRRRPSARDRCSGGSTTTTRTTTSPCASGPSSATGSPASPPLTSWRTTPTARPVTCSTTGSGSGRSTTACASTRRTSCARSSGSTPGLAVEEHLLERIDRFAKGEVGEVARWLNPSELALAQLRAHGLVENALYPEPDEDLGLAALPLAAHLGRGASVALADGAPRTRARRRSTTAPTPKNPAAHQNATA